MDSRIAAIAERLRQREERYEAAKKNRRVSFQDQQEEQQQTEEPKLEEICIFKAEKIRKRAEEWPNEQVKRPDLYKKFFHGIKEHFLDDVHIKFGRICFKCPLILLTCFTKSFKNYDENMTIHLNDIQMKPKCFSYILRWMMMEAVDGKPGLEAITHTIVLEMLNGAKILKIAHLEDQCWYFLMKTARCNEKLAFQIYKATAFNFKEIQQLMLSRICKYFLTLVASEDFLNLTADEICTLFSLNTVGVNSEIEIFYAAVLWLNSVWSERRKAETLQSVMKCVRFNLMPSWFLVSLDEGTGHEEVDKIAKDPFVLNLVTDGIIFTANQLSNTVEKCFEKFNLKHKNYLPVQRHWLYDKSCVYHFRPNSEFMHYVTFPMFVNYLKCLRKYGEDYWRTMDFAESDHCERMWKSRPSIKYK